MLNNVVAGALGAIFGLVVAVSTLAFTARPWATGISVIITVLLVAALAWYLLYDSEHQALEQRWLLYRRRAREEAEAGEAR